MISINRLSRIIVAIILLIIILIVGFFLVRRVLSADDYGEPLALCPGPDFYGYVCESGTAFSYIDATDDTQLYALDGVAEIALPFPFTFYGTTYDKVLASTNGNVQFGNGNSFYINSCLVDGSAKPMGEMIAPYWDDLDLRESGFLETAVIGEEPNRIFIIEWDDVPRFGDDEDRVTFEIQLFEESNDILFLYADVTSFEGNNGSSATIGLQSAAHDIALQFGCNQPVVANATQLRFPHPSNANGAVDSLDTTNIPSIAQDEYSQPLRAETANVLQQINLYGINHIPQLRQNWLQQSPSLRSDWQAVDFNGDTIEEIIIVRYGTTPDNHHAELLVLGKQSPTAEYTVWQQQYLSNRAQPIPTLTIFEHSDVTGDNLQDVILFDEVSGTVFMMTTLNDMLQLLTIDDDCTGQLKLEDSDGNGRIELIRNGCAGAQRVHFEWDGTHFQAKP